MSYGATTSVEHERIIVQAYCSLSLPVSVLPTFERIPIPGNKLKISQQIEDPVVHLTARLFARRTSSASSHTLQFNLSNTIYHALPSALLSSWVNISAAKIEEIWKNDDEGNISSPMRANNTSTLPITTNTTNLDI